MDIACDAAILFAERHAELAEAMAAAETDPRAPAELAQHRRGLPPRARRRRRATSGRPCRCTGSSTWARSPSSTAGTR